MSSQNRNPAGTPTGGQFSEHDRADDSVQLDDGVHSVADFAQGLEDSGLAEQPAKRFAAAMLVAQLSRDMDGQSEKLAEQGLQSYSDIYRICRHPLLGLPAKLNGYDEAAGTARQALAEARVALFEATFEIRKYDGGLSDTVDGLLMNLENFLEDND
jgi:hypothetical protein